MSEVIHNTTEEFWRPPVAQVEPCDTSALAGACAACGSEFMIGARFCHTCGAGREPIASSPTISWTRSFRFLEVLEFHSVQRWLGLSVPSLFAFIAGLGCILAAILVGIIYSAQNLADFQAIQLWRMQWLLGALVAFAAGILLKSAGVSRR